MIKVLLSTVIVLIYLIEFSHGDLSLNYGNWFVNYVDILMKTFKLFEIITFRFQWRELKLQSNKAVDRKFQ